MSPNKPPIPCSPARISTRGFRSFPLSPAERRRNLTAPPFTLCFTTHARCKHRDKHETIYTKPTERFALQKKGFSHYDGTVSASGVSCLKEQMRKDHAAETNGSTKKNLVTSSTSDTSTKEKQQQKRFPKARQKMLFF